MKLILIERGDGGVSVLNVPDDFTPERIADHVRKWEANAVQLGYGLAVSTRVVKKEDLPSRRFRNAWKLQTGQIVEDLARAKLIREVQLAMRQKGAMTRLNDVIEAGLDDNLPPGQVNALRGKRNLLRKLDLKAKLASVATVDELEVYVPSEITEAEGAS